MSPQADQSDRIIGELDPEAMECLNCRKYYDQQYVISVNKHMLVPPVEDFVEWLFHRRLYYICDNCFHLLRDAFDTGYLSATKVFEDKMASIDSYVTKDKYMYDLQNTGIKVNNLSVPQKGILKKLFSKFEFFKDNPSDLLVQPKMKWDIFNET